MNLKYFVFICLALFAGSASVHGLGVANFTEAKGAMSNGASGSLVLLPPINQDNVGELVLYVFTISDILKMTSSQILLGGEIVAEVIPTNTEIDNADYAGIITYSESEDPNPVSDLEEVTIDGVKVSQYKDGYTTTGKQQFSGSLDDASLLGPLEGKTIKDFEAALKAGNLTVVVRTESYKDGELVGDIKSEDLPAPVKAAVAKSSSRLATIAGGVLAGVTALFI